eukprot:scaffold28084_cov59-Phaeocystis_antarctica.AAC.3
MRCRWGAERWGFLLDLNTAQTSSRSSPNAIPALQTISANLGFVSVMAETSQSDLKNDLKKAVDASSGGSSGSHCSGHATAR